VSNEQSGKLGGGGFGRRRAGILLHPTSLPGPPDLGDLGPAAEAFLAWAAAAGQGLWQVLPLGPTGYGDSPYGALSSFAGDPLLISPERLVEEGLLPAGELAGAAGAGKPGPRGGGADYRRARVRREKLLRAACEHFRRQPPSGAPQALAAFAAAEALWLGDWALFAALRRKFRGRPWTRWPAALRRRRPPALARAREELAAEVDFQIYLQWLFAGQWRRLRQAAADLGILILGDLPIYLPLDSADVWARPELFDLDDDGRPLALSGVPPDRFSPTGQLWGTPVYRWGRHREEGFRWWIDRVAAALARFDLLRLDHFRGFEASWRVPAGAATAARGEWVPGPGRELFDALREALGEPPLVAEDLGFITPEVAALRTAAGLPGMKVLQFAFAEPDSDHLPHRHTPASVVYTGTHDTDTARGWFAGAGDDERRRARDYLGGDGSAIEWDLIRAAYTSVAELAIVPIQDPLGLGSEARLNTPGRSRGNWTWRLREGALTEALAARLRRLAEVTGRLAAAPRPQGMPGQVTGRE
jgi:4-alpha-glucanotransferase